MTTLAKTHIPVITVDAEFRDTVNVFLQDRREDIERIRYSEAVGDYQYIAYAVYMMKGEAEALGFPEIYYIGRELEAATLEHNSARIDRTVEELESYLDRVQVRYAQPRVLSDEVEPKQGGGRGKPRGFALGDLLATVVGLTVFVSLIALSLQFWSQYESVHLARAEFLDLTSRAYAHASRQNEPVGLHLDLAGDSAWIDDGRVTLATVRFAPVDIRAARDTYTLWLGQARNESNPHQHPLDLEFVLGSNRASVLLTPNATTASQ